MEAVALFLVQLCYGMSNPVAAQLLKTFNPVYCTAFRICCAAIVLSLWVWFRRLPPARSSFPKLILLSLLGIALTQLLFIGGMASSSATEAALAISTIPVWVYVANLWSGKEKFKLRRFAGLALAIVGVYVLFGGPRALASPLLLLSALTYAAYLFFAWPVMRVEHPLRLVCTLFSISAVVLVVICVVGSLAGYLDVTNVTNTLASPTNAWRLSVLVMIGTVAPYSLNAFAARKMSSHLLAIAVTLQPLLTAFFETYLYGVHHDKRLLESGIMIGLGVAINVWQPKEKRA